MKSRGGWRSSYDGRLFSKEEMDEYANDVYIKLNPYLSKKEAVALEIGCASGITMYRIAPYVKEYIGTDMAGVNLEKKARLNERNSIRNIVLEHCRADQIDEFEKRGVCIVIMNSVIQYFSDEDYLIDVIRKAAGIIKKEGIIYLGDIREKEKRVEFEESVRQYRKEYGLKVPDFKKGNELFLGRGWVRELAIILPDIAAVEISDKVGNVENELLKYRFDVLLKVRKDGKMQI